MHGRVTIAAILALFCGLAGSASAQDRARFDIRVPEGHAAIYEHTFEYRFYSDRAEYVRSAATDGGSVRLSYSGEWTSQEALRPYESEADSVASPDTLAVYATILDGSSRVVLDDEKMSFEKFPYTLDRLIDRTFRWRLAPDGVRSNFEPDFRKWRLDRVDMITELCILWLPEVAPVPPASPVGQGDSWSGTHTYGAYFSSLYLPGERTHCTQTSTYVVKKARKRKGNLILEIEEDREITEYKAWLHVEEVSQLIEGAGRATGKWVIDATQGLVLEHEVRLDISRPTLTPPGDSKPLHDVRAEYQLIFQRKFKELKKI